MRKLVATNNIEKDEWLKHRKRGITGTDVKQHFTAKHNVNLLLSLMTW